MSENTERTRRTQWKHYFRFCEIYSLEPLPADIQQVCRYLAYMAESFKYSSITNYLSALWSLHRINGYTPLAHDSFEIKITLMGIKRLLGSAPNQAKPMDKESLKKIFAKLNMSDTEDIAFWLSLLVGFRGLVRKSNMFNKDMAFKRKELSLHTWGIRLVSKKSKTIQFQERELEVVLSSIPGSIFCAKFYFQLLLALVTYPNENSQLLAYQKHNKYIRCTYEGFQLKLKNYCTQLGMSYFTSHSLRRGGATALAEIGISLSDIKRIGDWKSMVVLNYLERTTASRIRLDEVVVSLLYR